MSDFTTSPMPKKGQTMVYQFAFTISLMAVAIITLLAWGAGLHRQLRERKKGYRKRETLLAESQAERAKLEKELEYERKKHKHASSCAAKFKDQYLWLVHTFKYNRCNLEDLLSLLDGKTLRNLSASSNHDAVNKKQLDRLAAHSEAMARQAQAQAQAQNNPPLFGKSGGIS